jgi:cysteine desulfurase/selenocysteine lyase|tara:strand:+ start:2881 stop:4074 length:1194 start_codon:yes stop_codon:yes gene_type:complete
MSQIKKDFPIFSNFNDKPFIYFDNAATTQKPKLVLDALSDFYIKYNSNVHRGVYSIAEKATHAYESARYKVQKFLNAPKVESIVFTKGATESINLVANSWGLENLSKGDEILITEIEHHSNIVPWQMVADKTGAELKYIPLKGDKLDVENFDKYITSKTKFVSVIHQSNVLGVINNIDKIIELSHAVGAKVLIDASQSIVHKEIDVQNLDCDFLVFSGHKIMGPTGVGVLYGKSEILENMSPFLFGGEMINSVEMNNSTYNDIPWKFEAGTPNIAQAIGLGFAIDYINGIGIDNISNTLDSLGDYLFKKIMEIPRIKLYNSTSSHIVSFNIEGVNPYDLAMILDQYGICIRVGHLCTQPIMRRNKVSSMSRISVFIYNDFDEIDFVVSKIKDAITKL